VSDNERLDGLERRLQRVEDELAITQLIASYGPLVDAGEADAVAALWSEDGSYDVENWQMRSRADVRDMVTSDAHQGLLARGAAHFVGPASVRLDGDEATAVCESLLVVRREGRFVVARAAANRFRLRRFPAGWLVVERTSRVLDGSGDGRALLGRS
jgi:3-phenylpropionate/cinnamic acid dioxygenase small subunit